MKRKIKNIIRPIRRLVYKLFKGKPWTYGYLDTRWEHIRQSILSNQILVAFAKNETPPKFAIGFDERTVEYPWIFSRLLHAKGNTILDAGSTFNYPEIISQPIFSDNELNIYTFYPEENQFLANRISYQFGDLRELPYKDDHFDKIVCQSTIEHVDMDNSIYGYELEKVKDASAKSYEYMKVIHELIRVLKPGGTLLLTFPYGKFQNYGFFQQFDAGMVQEMKNAFTLSGNFTDQYLQYQAVGWRFANAVECANSTSYNPHTGEGKEKDGAAHSRAICCIEFVKA
jgi:SAM-dependent methyltransferase